MSEARECRPLELKVWFDSIATADDSGRKKAVDAIKAHVDWQNGELRLAEQAKQALGEEIVDLKEQLANAEKTAGLRQWRRS